MASFASRRVATAEGCHRNETKDRVRPSALPCVRRFHVNAAGLGMEGGAVPSPVPMPK